MNGVTPAFLLLLAVLCFAIVAVKKENIIVPLIVAMCFLPADISIQVMTLDFYAVRVVALVALLRIYLSGDNDRIRMNSIDHLFIFYNVLGALIYILASQDRVGAFIFKSGNFVDSVILYVVIRNVIYSKESLRLIIKTFSVCVAVLLPFIIFEYYSASNLFAVLGRSAISFRNGEIRTSATFSHSILFGSFAAALVPILWAEYKNGRTLFKLLAVFCCVFFVYTSSSSGPIVVLAGVIFFLFFFRWKQYSRLLFWVSLTAGTIIHFVRESPIWHLLYVRISVKSGSTGWHRYQLMEAAVKEFKNWWLLGYGDTGPQWHTKYWAYTHATFTDVTNHYLLLGVRGGFFTMFLFIVLCYKVVKTLGACSICQDTIEDQWLWWGFTVMMLAHCITFLSVAYFGQITMLLYLSIAIGAFAHDELMREREQAY